MINETISTIVVIAGLATRAGSSPIFFASRGRAAPESFAQTTVVPRVRDTTAATASVTPSVPRIIISTSITLRKHAADRESPQSSETLNSLKITFKISCGDISPSDRARMTVTDACEPEFPPVSISIGMNAVSATSDASALSKCVMISPVKVADTIIRRSHGILEAKVRMTPVLR